MLPPTPCSPAGPCPTPPGIWPLHCPLPLASSAVFLAFGCKLSILKICSENAGTPLTSFLFKRQWVPWREMDPQGSNKALGKQSWPSRAMWPAEDSGKETCWALNPRAFALTVTLPATSFPQNLAHSFPSFGSLFSCYLQKAASASHLTTEDPCPVTPPLPTVLCHPMECGWSLSLPLPESPRQRFIFSLS